MPRALSSPLTPLPIPSSSGRGMFLASCTTGRLTSRAPLSTWTGTWLSWLAEIGHCPRLLVEKGENSTAVLLTLVPRVEDLVTVPSEVVFLIDCSGSMHGQSILMAKEALSLLLNSLPTNSTFNIELCSYPHVNVEIRDFSQTFTTAPFSRSTIISDKIFG